MNMKRLLAVLGALLLMAGLLPAGGAGEGVPEMQETEDTVIRLPDEVLMTYYDGSLFAGDSLMHSFHNFVNKKRKDDPGYFSGITFRTADSFKFRFATYKNLEEKDGAHLKDGGEKTTLYKIAVKLQPSKVFILAGLNDKLTTDYKQKDGSIWTGMERATGYVEKVYALLGEAVPGAKLYIISQLPVTATIAKKRPGVQLRWDAVNEALAAKCEELGAYYVEVAAFLKDGRGLLPADLSSDGEDHLNDRGNTIFARVLLDYAQAEYEAGNWVPAKAEAGE